MTKRAILALDLGTTTGFAFSNGHASGSGEWKLKPNRHESSSLRFTKFQQKLDELHNVCPIGAVYYEAVENHSSTYAAQTYGGFEGGLHTWCEARKIPFKGVPVGTLKKFATGRGNAAKSAMVVAARAFGYELLMSRHNEADAVCLLHYAMEEQLFGSVKNATPS